MPFWLHQPKMILVINGMSQVKKLLITTGLCLGIFGGWYAYYMFYAKMMLHQKQQKYKDLQHQQSLFNETSMRYDQVMQEHKQLSLQFDAIVHKNVSIQKTITKLLSLMRKKGLSCRGIKPTKVKSKDRYKKHYFSLVGKGDFRKFVEFLDDAESIGKPMKIKSLIVKKDKHSAVFFKAVVRFLAAG